MNSFNVACQVIPTSSLLRVHECSECIAQRNRSKFSDYSLLITISIPEVGVCKLTDVSSCTFHTTLSTQLVSRSNHLLVAVADLSFSLQFSRYALVSWSRPLKLELFHQIE